MSGSMVVDLVLGSSAHVGRVMADASCHDGPTWAGEARKGLVTFRIDLDVSRSCTQHPYVSAPVLLSCRIDFEDGGLVGRTVDAVSDVTQQLHGVGCTVCPR